MYEDSAIGFSNEVGVVIVHLEVVDRKALRAPKPLYLLNRQRRPHQRDDRVPYRQTARSNEALPRYVQRVAASRRDGNYVSLLFSSVSRFTSASPLALLSSFSKSSKSISWNWPLLFGQSIM